MEWEPPSIEICLRCAEAERQDSMIESDLPPTMWPLPPDFLAREWFAIVRQRQQAERQLRFRQPQIPPFRSSP
jgi:hypothetical protein